MLPLKLKLGRDSAHHRSSLQPLQLKLVLTQYSRSAGKCPCRTFWIAVLPVTKTQLKLGGRVGMLYVEKSQPEQLQIWVCLKIGYIPNYSHLIGIMIINHWV